MITTDFNSTTGVLTLYLHGDLLSSNGKKAVQAFETALSFAPRYKALWIDCSASRMIDSVGLNILFNVLSHAKEQLAEPKIIITAGSLERILQAAQITKMFPVEVRGK